jgi:polar amino acid transport system substrate-binding protein
MGSTFVIVIGHAMRHDTEVYEVTNPPYSTRQALARTSTTLLVLTTLLMTLSALVRAETIIITNGHWPPYQSEELKYYGFVSLMVEEAFALEGIDVDFRFRPWKRAYEEARTGAAHASMVWSYTPERDEFFLFSDVIIVSDSVLFHLKETNFNWSSNSDLEKYVIGGTLGYRYSIEDWPGNKIERVPTDTQNFAKLLAGRIQLFPSDMYAGYALLNQEMSVHDRNKITHHPKPYDRTPYSVIFSKKRPENRDFLKQFNDGLANLKTSGRYNAILESQQRGDFAIK